MIKSLRERMKRVALLVGVALVFGNPASAGLCDFDGERAVANRELDEMRGGFVTPGGLQISLGIIKAVAVDGVLKTISTWSIPQLTKRDIASAVPVTVMTVASTTVPAASNSPANDVATADPVTVPSGSVTPAAGISSIQTDAATLVQNLGNAIVVQNSADQVKIQNATILNVTGNMKTIMNQVNMAYRINQQMINMTR